MLGYYESLRICPHLEDLNDLIPESVRYSSLPIRVFTLIVLIISDLDFLFSILFACHVSQLEGSYQWGWVVYVVGLIVYFAGVLYLAPKARFKVVGMLKDRMAKHPNDFQSPLAERENGETIGRVKLTSPITPGDTSQNRTTFQDLTNSPEDWKKARNAMGAYNLIHEWNFCEAKISKNTCERKNGIPFLRLVRFMFVAEPFARDLSSILNAKTLYTFLIGTFQLVYGLILMFAMNQIQIEVLLPVAISGYSLLWSVVHVIMDLPTAVLTDIEHDNRFMEEIRQNSKSLLEERNKITLEARDEAFRSVDEKYPGTGAADLHDKSKEKFDVMNWFQIEIQENEQDIKSWMTSSLYDDRAFRQGKRRFVSRRKEFERIKKHVEECVHF